jgi:hypothetical protein
MQNSDRMRPSDGGAASPAWNGLTAEEVRSRLQQGWKAVRFEFCFSCLIATVRRQSPVYLTSNWQERYIRGMGYNLVALVLGPWGVPWGLLWTARAVWTNISGGIDASTELLGQLQHNARTTTEPF